MSGRGENQQRPALLAGAGHLAALWALALVQPLFDLLGRNPDFFVARGNGGGDIVIFALAFTLLPPLAALATEALAMRLAPRLHRPLHLTLFALLAAALALQVLGELFDRPAGVLIGLSVVLGCLATLAYARSRFATSFMDVLIPAPLVVVAAFLVFSDVSGLVFPEDDPEPIEIAIERPAPVVMIVLDELPTASLLGADGQIDASRFPGFAELAAGSTWYRDATTVAAFTPQAVPAILTGDLPGPDELPVAADLRRSVFTLLGGSYRMQVMENATRVCPANLCPAPEGGPGRGERLSDLAADLRVVSGHLLLPGALREGLPAIDQTFGGFAAEAGDDAGFAAAGGNADQLAAGFAADVTEDESDRVATFAGQLDLAVEPTLYAIHIEKPHYPWTHLPNGQRYSSLISEFKPFFGEDSTWLASPALTDIALQRHLLETGYTDLLLRTMIRRMKRTGLWRQALVVVAADHGGAFTAGEPRRNPVAANIGQIAPVPVFIKEPSQDQAEIVSEPFCTTDIVPRIAGILGIDYPWERHRCPAGEVTVADSPSGEFTAVAAEIRAGERAYRARIERLFGTGDGWGPVLAFGPHRDLVGTDTDAGLSPLVGENLSATLDDSGTYTDVTPNAANVFASLVRGELSGLPPDSWVAVSVNGTFAGVGQSFDEDGAVRYSIVVPPGFFKQGENEVELHYVSGAGEARIGP